MDSLLKYLKLVQVLPTHQPTCLPTYRVIRVDLQYTDLNHLLFREQWIPIICSINKIWCIAGDIQQRNNLNEQNKLELICMVETKHLVYAMLWFKPESDALVKRFHNSGLKVKSQTVVPKIPSPLMTPVWSVYLDWVWIVFTKSNPACVTQLQHLSQQYKQVTDARHSKIMLFTDEQFCCSIFQIWKSL